MFRFLHVADIHLDSPMRGLERYEGAPVDRLRDTTRQALKNMVSTALAEQVAFVLIAGDLYDGDWRGYETGLFLVGQMNRLREAGIPVYIIQGNHDAANRMTKDLRLPDNVRKFGHRKAETMRLEDLQVAIHGQSFATQAVVDNLAADYPAGERGWFNIGLLHTCGTGREGHASYAPCTLDTLRGKNYDYWALGHIHQREIWHAEPHIVYSGNLQGRSVRETGAKGCMLVTVDDAGRTAVEPRFVDVLRWERCVIDCADVQGEADILERVDGRFRALLQDADDRMLAIRVEFAGACPIQKQLTSRRDRYVNEIRSLANNHGEAWVEKVIDRTVPQRLPALADLDDGPLGDGPLGELEQLVAEIRADHERLMGLGETLADLKKKLPAELKDIPDGLDLDDPAQLRELLEQARRLLVGRLVAAGDEA